VVIEQYDKTVDGESIVDFLTRTRNVYQTSGTIHMVLDGAGYHCSGLVTEAAKRLDITLHYLPPYSPNLNPIERLWKVMNKHAGNSQYFATTKVFRRQIGHFFTTTLPDIVDPLGGTINDNFQQFNPAF
jgi:transposase